MKLRIDIDIEIPTVFAVSVMKQERVLAAGRSEDVAGAFDLALASVDEYDMDAIFARVVLQTFRDSLGDSFSAVRAQA